MFNIMFVVCLCVFALHSSYSLPTYLKGCSQNDQVCMLKQAQTTLTGLLEGDKSLGIPALNPLILPSVNIKTPGLNVQLTNIKVEGIPEGDIEEVSIDTTKKTGKVLWHMPFTYLTGDYFIDGKVLVLSLHGNGKANLTSINGKYVWTFNYKLENRGGKEYAKITDYKTDFVMDKAYFYFDDLFKDDSSMTMHTNEVLNDNWREIAKDLGPELGDIIGSVFTSVTTSLFNKYPFDELLLM